MPDNMAERIKRLRESRGWNRKQLSELAGLSASHVGLLERGVRVGVRPDTISKLAHTLGVTEQYLITGDINVDEYAPYHEAIRTAKACGMSSDDLLKLIRVVAEIKNPHML